MPESPRPPISVVIATRDRANLLERCIKQVQVGYFGGDEILVVDSASTNHETARVAAANGARYVRLDVPGLSRARNAGWRHASHELVAFIDDDVLVHEGWRDAMSKALADPDNTFVTGWIGVPPEQEGAVDPQPHIVLPDRLRLDRHSPRHWGAGANIGIRRSVLAEVGGFDERLGAGTWFAGAEDFDVFDRLVAAGHYGEYRPDVRVDHDAWRTRRGRMAQYWSYGKGSGARIRLLLHRDRPRAWRSARLVLWKRGVKQAILRMQDRWWDGAVCSLLRVAGAIAGFVVAYPQLRQLWPPDGSD